MEKIFVGMFIYISFTAVDCSSQINYTWNAAASSSNWNTTTNWLPNGVPSASDNVIIVNSSNAPVYSGVSPVKNFTISSGNLNLGGNNLIITGVAAFNGGTISSGIITPSGTSATFSTTTFNSDVNAVCNDIYLNGGVFNNPLSIEKTGNANNNGTGGINCNASVSLKNSGSGNLLTGYTSSRNDIFNGPITLTVAGTGSLYLAYNSLATQFNDDITVNSTGRGYIYIGTAATAGASSLNPTKTINVGTFIRGGLRLAHFTQLGNTPQTITLPGDTCYFLLEGGVIFNADLTVTAAYIASANSRFKGVTVLEKNGVANYNVSGGNTFEDSATLIQSGAGNWLWGNSFPDIFNKEVTLVNRGTDVLAMGYNHSGATPTQFNDNVIINSYGTSSRGITFGGNNGTCSMAAGKTLTIGSDGFTSGDLSIRHFTQTGSTAQVLTGFANNTGIRILTGTTFYGDVTIKAPHIYLGGAVYNGTATFETTASTLSNGAGGNVFNGVTTLTKSGSGYFMTGQYTADVFNSDLYLNNTDDSYIYLAYGHTNLPPTQFNGNVIISCTAATTTSGILIGSTGISSSTLAVGKVINVGASGFTAGQLTLRNLTQNGITPISISLTGTAILNLSANTTFNAPVNFKAPGLTINQNTFNNTAVLEKTGAGTSSCYGGNVFNETISITNSGSGAFQMGQTAADVFNKEVTVNNFSSGQSIYFGYSHSAVQTTQFNDNVILNSTGTSAGISLGRSTATTALAAGKIISIGSSGFTVGSLRIRNFTQQGSTAQSIVLTGTATLTVGPAALFNGDVSFTASGISLSGGTYNGTAYFEKRGAQASTGTGNNTFNGQTTIVNAATATNYFRNNGNNTFNAPVTFINNATADILFENTLGSTYNLPVTFHNNGSSNIRVAYAGNTFFNDNLTFNATAGTGVVFCESTTATATLATGKTLSIGASGFNSGQLLLSRYSQLGNTPQTIALTGNALLQLGPASTFNGNVNFIAPQLLLSGCTYNGTAYLEKNGGINNTGAGNNIFNATALLVNSNTSGGTLRTNGNNTFNDTTTLKNTATGDLLLELTTGSNYNSDLTVNNTGTSAVRIGYLGNTTFNGNVIVNNTGSYISIGEAAAATVTMAAGKTLAIGNAPGFTTGNFNIYHFTQLGNTPQNIALTGTSILTTGSATTFNGDVILTAPGILLNGCTFNGITTVIKNGTVASSCTGANIFNSVTTITSSGTGNFTLATATADDYNSDVTFIRTGSGALYPAYNANCTFAGDIATTGSNGVVNFASSTNGRVTIDGGIAQNINGSAAFPPEFYKLTVNKSAGQLQLNVPVNITSSLNLTGGNIVSSSTNLINFRDNAVVTGASHASFVNGPVRKTGNDAFTFPVGKGSLYRPVGISAPAALTDHFTAEYFENSANTLYSLTSKAATIARVSGCEYWILNRTNGSSNVSVNLSWETYNGSCSGVSSLSDIIVARWNGTSWVNHGAGTITGNSLLGSVTTAAAVTSFSPFALASTSPFNPLPITLLEFYAVKQTGTVNLKWKTATETNNDYFTVERSADGDIFTTVARIKGAGNSNAVLSYSLPDEKPFTERAIYYRLKQTDYDNKFTYSPVIAVENAAAENGFLMYPNPADGGMLTVKPDTYGENGLLYITDAMGKIIYKQEITGNNQPLTISLAEISKGIYTVYLSNGNKHGVQRLVIR